MTQAEAQSPPRMSRQYMSVWLWVAVAGAVLQLMGLGSDFYTVPATSGAGGVTQKGAWLGIPHTSDLILISALVAIVLFALTAANHSPLRGRSTGLWIGVAGLLATLQLGYRMIAPPFNINVQGDQTVANVFSGDCQFYCSPAAASGANTQLLAGIWFGLVGCVLVAVAGFAHAASRRASTSPAKPRVAAEQPGRDPWLILAGAGSAAAFIVGYTVFPFYTTMGKGGPVSWSGWLPTPHTSSLVGVLTVTIVWLVTAAARNRSPLGTSALGGTIGVCGFIITSRIFLRVLAPPFGSGASIELPAYVALGASVLVIIAGAAIALGNRHPVADQGLRAQPA